MRRVMRLLNADDNKQIQVGAVRPDNIIMQNPWTRLLCDRPTWSAPGLRYDTRGNRSTRDDVPISANLAVDEAVVYVRMDPFQPSSQLFPLLLLLAPRSACSERKAAVAVLRLPTDFASYKLRVQTPLRCSVGFFLAANRSASHHIREVASFGGMGMRRRSFGAPDL